MDKTLQLAFDEAKKYGVEADFVTEKTLPSFEIRRAKGRLVIAAPNSIETLYGVYECAELFYGYTFFEPGRDRFDASLKVDFTAPGVPNGRLAFARRPLLKRRGFIQEFPFNHETPMLFDWMAKNKLNYLLVWMKYYDELSDELKEMAAVRGITIESGHHNFNYWIPGKVYGKTHPEFFAEINGKRINKWEFTNGQWAWVTIVRVGNENFLEIEVDNWRTESLKCGLYKVKNNKLKCVLDYSSLLNTKTLMQNDFADTGTECTFFEARKVKGNTIYLGGTISTKALGQVNFDNLKLNYKNGKFKLDTSAAKGVSAPRDKDGLLVSYFTAGKKITAYKKPGSSAKAFTIAKGKQFKITKLAVVKKQIYLRVRSKNGKLGWIKAGKSKLVTVRTPYVEE